MRDGDRKWLQCAELNKGMLDEYSIGIEMDNGIRTYLVGGRYVNVFKRAVLVTVYGNSIRGHVIVEIPSVYTDELSTFISVREHLILDRCCND